VVQLGESREANATERRCPGCGVSIFSGQTACGFCQRQAAQQANVAKKRYITLGVALGLVLTAVAATTVLVLAPQLWRNAEVAPEPKRPAPVFVEVTSSDVRVDGTPVWQLPPRQDQARTGLVNRAVTGGDEWRKAILDAIALTARQRPHDGALIEVKMPPDMPAAVLEQLSSVREQEQALHIAVEASALGPASTLFFVRDKSKGNTPVLLVEVRTHGVAVTLIEGRKYQNVGIGCTVHDGVGGGLAQMLRRPEDYRALQACFSSLRARFPAGVTASPRVKYLGSVPSAKVIYVINLLRCGEVRCREDAPRVWDIMTLTATDEYWAAPDEMIPIIMTRLEPSLRTCFTEARAQLSEPNYETELHFLKRSGKELQFGIEPGLPPMVEACATRVLRDAKISLPQAQPDVFYRVPLAFGD
jgi:hypothetical protein